MYRLDSGDPVSTYCRFPRTLNAGFLAKRDRDAALNEMDRVNVVDGRQLGLAPI